MRRNVAVLQASTRRYLTNALNRVVVPLEQRVSMAKSEFRQRSLLKANYPAFNEICRQFHTEVNSTRRQINHLPHTKEQLSQLVSLFDAGIRPFENTLSALVNQLFQILSIPDSTILGITSDT